MNIKQALTSYNEYINNIEYVTYNNIDNIITKDIEEKYNKIIEEIK